MGQFTQNNLFFDAEQQICNMLLSSDLSSIQVLPENTRDIENEITKALGKQGVVAIVYHTQADFQGILSGVNTVFQSEIEVKVIENVITNRSSANKSFIGTSQDIAVKVTNVLGAQYGRDQTFQLVDVKTEEDSGFLVTTVRYKVMLADELSGVVEPKTGRYIPFATRPEIEALSADVSALSQEWKEISASFSLSSIQTANSKVDANGTKWHLTELSTWQSDGNFALSNDVAANFQPIGNYVSATALLDYYKKSETSSASQTSSALDAKADLSRVASISSALSTAIDNKATCENVIAQRTSTVLSVKNENGETVGTVTVDVVAAWEIETMPGKAFAAGDPPLDIQAAGVITNVHVIDSGAFYNEVGWQYYERIIGSVVPFTGYDKSYVETLPQFTIQSSRGTLYVCFGENNFVSTGISTVGDLFGDTVKLTASETAALKASTTWRDIYWNYYSKSATSSAIQLENAFNTVDSNVKTLSSKFSDYYDKKQVDAALSGKVSLSGDSMTGALDLPKLNVVASETNDKVQLVPGGVFVKNAEEEVNIDAQGFDKYDNDYDTHHILAFPVNSETTDLTDIIAVVRDIPTNVSQLSNDSGYLTSADAYLKSETSSATQIQTEMVKYLPLSGGIVTTGGRYSVNTKVDPGEIQLYRSGLVGSSTLDITNEKVNFSSSAKIADGIRSDLSNGDYSSFAFIKNQEVGLSEALSAVQKNAVANAGLSNYYKKSETSSATEITQGIESAVSNYLPLSGGVVSGDVMFGTEAFDNQTLINKDGVYLRYKRDADANIYGSLYVRVGSFPYHAKEYRLKYDHLNNSTSEPTYLVRDCDLTTKADLSSLAYKLDAEVQEISNFVRGIFYGANDEEVTLADLMISSDGQFKNYEAKYSVKFDDESEQFFIQNVKDGYIRIADSSTEYSELSISYNSTAQYLVSDGDGDEDEITYRKAVFSGTSEKILNFDEMLSTHLSSHVLSANALSAEIDKLEVELYGGDKNKSVVAAIKLSRLFDQLNAYSKALSIETLSGEPDVQTMAQKTEEIYNIYGLSAPAQLSTMSSLYNAVHDIGISTDLSTTLDLSMKRALFDIAEDLATQENSIAQVKAYGENTRELIPTCVSQLSNNLHYAKWSGVKQYAYKKSETSSAVELENAFANIQLSDVYKKSETSSAAELSDAFSHLDISSALAPISAELSTKTDTLSATQIARNQVEAFHAMLSGLTPLSADCTANELVGTINSIIAAMKASIIWQS